MSLFSKKAYVGLDIGHHTLKAVQVERTISGWRIAKSVTARTPVDTVRDGVVVDPAALGLAIKAMLKGAHIVATSASIAISGGTVVVRPVRMPKMAESALRKSIRFEASRYVPNSVEDSYIEFEIVGDVDSVNMDVLIAAAPRELVDSRIKACEHAGLDVENVELAAFAVHRSIIESDHAHAWSEKTLGLIDIGAQVTNLGVVSHGVFSMTRAIPAGGQIFTDHLKSYFKLSDEDAESGKGQLDVRALMTEGGATENPPLRVLQPHIDDLVREVRRSINYWQSQQGEANSAKQVDALVLCGGGSGFQGLAEYFEHKLGIHTVTLGIYDNPRFLGAHSEYDHGLDLGVAVGLAMGLAPSKVAAKAAAPEKAKAEKPAKAQKPPKPPKDPKPSKPPKGGKTFKVTREVADETPEVATPIANEVAEERELVSAVAPTVAVEAPAPAPAPVFEAPVAEAPAAPPAPAVPIAEAPLEVQEAEAPLAETPTVEVETEEPSRPITAEPPQPRTFARSRPTPAATEAPVSFSAEADEIAAKYGGEVAALLGAFDADVKVTTHAEAEPVPTLGSEPDVQALLEGAFDTPDLVAPTPAPEAPVEVPVQEAPTAPTATAAPVVETIDERAALLTQPAPPTATAQAPAAKEKSGLGSSLAGWLGVGKSDKEPKAPKAAKAAKVKPVAEVKPKKPVFGKKSVAAEEPAQAKAPAAEKKSAFSIGAKKEKAPKAEKPAKAAKAPKEPKVESESGAKPGVGMLVSWLMGSPKPEHVKPTGVLTPKNPAPPITPIIPEASEGPGPRIELLKGSDLESNHAMPETPVEPVLLEAEAPAAKATEAKPKARKSPAKKAQAPEPQEAQKKEAA